MAASEQQPRPGKKLTRRQILRRIGGGLALGGVATIIGVDRAIDLQEAAARKARIKEFQRTQEALQVLPPDSPLIGGNWQVPKQGAIIKDHRFPLITTAFAAEGASPISKVVLTVNLPPEPEFFDPRNPNAWRILDVLPANPDQVYKVTIDLAKLGITDSRALRFGCDVVNQAHQIKESPNGIRDVVVAV